MGLFSWLKGKEPEQVVLTPVTPENSGTLVLDTPFSGNISGLYSYSFDIDSTISDELQMVNRYREVAAYPDCDTAIEEIINEMIVVDQDSKPVDINLDNIPKQYKRLTNKITEEFNEILRLYHFNENAHDIAKRWYIDGRLYYFVTVDSKNEKKGIQKIQWIDPRKIKKITEITKESRDGIEVVTGEKTYYLFNDRGLLTSNKGIRLNPDVIIDVPSGIVESNSNKVISYMFKAIKPVNQLKFMEDALVIYRITRAPERRIFYVDVGNLPAQKAEQYVSNIMNKFRNKVQYDAATGEIKNNRNYQSMVEDYFLPRREGGKSTEIQTLPGGQALDQIQDVVYFQEKLYLCLGVPRQRLHSEAQNVLGRASEISREELRFSKAIQRLRNKFNILFRDALHKQLITKKILKEYEWEDISEFILFNYQHDNYFEELKKTEILNDRISALGGVEGYRGTYFSREWIAKNVMRFTDAEWKEMKDQIKKEKEEEAEQGQAEAPEGEGGEYAEPEADAGEYPEEEPQGEPEGEYSDQGEEPQEEPPEEYADYEEEPEEEEKEIPLSKPRLLDSRAGVRARRTGGRGFAKTLI